MNLREARVKHLKMTQRELAKSIGVSERTFIRYEQNGAPEPVMQLIERMVRDLARPPHEPTQNP